METHGSFRSYQLTEQATIDGLRGMTANGDFPDGRTRGKGPEATAGLSPTCRSTRRIKKSRCRHFLFSALLFCISSLPLACSKDSPLEPQAPRGRTIRILSGEGQRALPGSALREPVVVRVLNADGRPVSGTRVSFQPAADHGTADPASMRSGPGGKAAATWTLGADPGPQILVVSAAGTASEVGARSVDLEAELDSWFAPPMDSELAAIRADWSRREVGADLPAVELEEDFSLAGSAATLRIVSHQVAGLRHIGAIIEPLGAAPASLPVLVYAHGGDDGIALESTIPILALSLGELRDDFLYVIPSFRGEPLAYNDRSWTSEGPASPWDYDVDDALALVNVALETAPTAIPGHYGVIGASRGAGVALLMGARDRRIQRIVAFFGPTDLLNSWARDIIRDLLLGEIVHKTGVDFLRTRFIDPWWEGALSLAQIRLELIRRSPAYFAADLPAVQLHHGDLDGVVSVTQAESLIRAMESLGRRPPDFEAFIYEGGTHDIISLAGAIPRALSYLGVLVSEKGT